MKDYQEEVERKEPKKERQWTQKEAKEMDEREIESEIYGDEFILPKD